MDKQQHSHPSAIPRQTVQNALRAGVGGALQASMQRQWPASMRRRKVVRSVAMCFLVVTTALVTKACVPAPDYRCSAFRCTAGGYDDILVQIHPLVEILS